MPPKKEPNGKNTGFDVDQIKDLPKRPLNLENARSTSEAMVNALMDKFKAPANRFVAPFDIPSFNGEEFFVSFLFSLMENEWMRENAIIITFDAAGGGRLMGIGRKSDQSIWEGDEGKRHLNSNDVMAYDVPIYFKVVLSDQSGEDRR